MLNFLDRSPSIYISIYVLPPIALLLLLLLLFVQYKNHRRSFSAIMRHGWTLRCNVRSDNITEFCNHNPTVTTRASCTKSNTYDLFNACSFRRVLLSVSKLQGQVEYYYQGEHTYTSQVLKSDPLAAFIMYA